MRQPGLACQSKFARRVFGRRREFDSVGETVECRGGVGGDDSAPIYDDLQNNVQFFENCTLFRSLVRALIFDFIATKIQF